MAIYEGIDKNGKLIRKSKIVNVKDAGNYFKLSNSDYRLKNKLVSSELDGKELKYILTKGKMILLYDKDPNSLRKLPKEILLKRLFEITQLDIESNGIKLLHHQEAREKKEITKSMGLKSGIKGGKNLDNHEQFPWIKISPNSFDALVEDYDFKITVLGNIKFLS